MSEWESKTTTTPIPLFDQIAKALAEAQWEMQNPGFDSENPHFRNRFASLAAVRNAVVPVLAKHGIAVCQDLIAADGGINCVTILTHASGQQMRFGPLYMPAQKADAQGLGSAATYARRYALMSVCGVVGDADDDAEKAVGQGPDFILYDRVYKSLQAGLESGEDWRILETWDGLDEDQKREMWSNLRRWVPSGVTKFKADIGEALKRARVEIDKRNEPLGSDAA